MDVLHSHDWHTYHGEFLLREKYQDNPLYEHIKTVYTIHNLQFQGVFPPEVMYDLLELGDEYFHSEQLEFYGNVNFMKGALSLLIKLRWLARRTKKKFNMNFSVRS